MLDKDWKNKIKAIRDERILAMQAHADEMGISIRTYRKIVLEQGEEFSWRTMKRIEQYLDRVKQ